MNSQAFHRVRSIKTDGVTHSNANAIKLTIQCQAYEGEIFNHEINLFDLPTHVADAIDGLLSNEIRQSEAEIRADERRKVRAEIARTLTADPVTDRPF